MRKPRQLVRRDEATALLRQRCLPVPTRLPRRRELMLLFGGAMIAASPLRAQQKAMPVIGFLGSTSPRPFAPLLAAFHRALSETGYVQGQNVGIEYRWAEGPMSGCPNWPPTSSAARSTWSPQPASLRRLRRKTRP